MDEQEKQVLDLLGKAFDAFHKLESLHPSDLPEFTHAIHAAQNIVLSRGTVRAMRNVQQEINRS